MNSLAPWSLPNPCPQTPFYLYSKSRLSELHKEFRRHCPELKLHFAVKANHNPELLKFFVSQGDGLDLVSGGELERALEVGCEPRKMVFSGVGKTRTEIQRALDLGVGILNLESEQEFEKIDQLAARNPKICTELGIRFNPNVDAKTHPYISTGLRDHKFGVSADQAFELYQRPTRVPWGALSMHIGSQIMDLGCVEEALSEALQLATRLRSRGIRLRVLDIGGGLGVRYDQPHSIPNFRDFGRLVGPLVQKWKALQGPDAEVHCELGRALTAMAGILVTRVIGTKQGDTKNFVIVDASMTELLRPALYQAEHPIETIRTTAARQIFDVVGPVCESSDVLGCAIELPVDLVEDDILLIHGCGAYGRSMSSEYNLRRLPPELWTQ